MIKETRAQHDGPMAEPAPAARAKKAAPNKIKFTTLGVQRLRKPDTGQVVYWDSIETGLSLLVSYGGKKSFRASFPLRGDKYKITTLGEFPDLSIEEARDLTRQYRSSARKGIDPRQRKTPPPSELTFGSLVDAYIEKDAKKKQRTWPDTRRILTKNFKPWLNRRVVDITRTDARDVIESFQAKGQQAKAKVSHAWIRKLWKWAHSRDIVPNALMDNLGITFPKLKRTRVYTDAEIAAIWRAADQLKPDQAAFFKLLILLAPRKSALAGLEWSHIRDGVWTTPNALTKSTKGNEERVYQTPLTPLASRILAGLPHTHDRVFPTVDSRPTQRLSNVLVRNGAPADFMFHACRHTVATWLDKHGGASVYEIGLVLNHANAGVTANYIHGHALPLKLKWLTTWSDHVESVVTPAGAALLR